MSPHHNYRGEEHANWGWAAQLLFTVVIVGGVVYIIGLLMGWW